MNRKFLILVMMLFFIGFVLGNVADLSEEELGGTSDEIIVNEINSNPNLLQDTEVLTEVTLRASENSDFFNDNPSLKENWFSQFGVVDEGVEIEEIILEGGTIVKTKGEKATTFNVESVLGSIVKEDGSLVLPSGVEISSAIVSRGENKVLSVEGGIIEFKEDSKQEFNFKETIVKVGEKEFRSFGDEDVYFNYRNGETIVGGEFDEINSETGERISRVNGKMRITKSGDKILGDDSDEYTSYETFINGEPSNTFSVNKPTNYLENKDCVRNSNCISLKENILEVFSQDNEIRINSEDGFIDDLKVNQVIGDGFISFKDKNNNIIKSESSGIYVGGNMGDLDVNFEGKFQVGNNRFTQTYLKGGNLISQEGEVLGGAYGLRPEDDDSLIFKRVLVDEILNNRESIFKENEVNKLSNLKEGEELSNLIIRSASVNENMNLRKGKNFVKSKHRFDETGEIYQLEEGVLIASGEKFEPSPIYDREIPEESFIASSSGETLQEATGNALISASDLYRSYIQGESDLYVSEEVLNGEEVNSESYFKSYFEDSRAVFFKNVKIEKINVDKWGNYVVHISVQPGKLSR